MYNAKAVSVSFRGSSKSYTYSVPERLQDRWIQKGSLVVVLSPISGPEVVRVNEVFSHRPKTSYSFIKNIAKGSISPSPRSVKDFNKKKLEKEFDELVNTRFSSLPRRERRMISITEGLLMTKELVRFSSIN